MNKEPVSSWQAAKKILAEEGGPLHYKEITKRAIERGLIRPSPEAQTPEQTLRAVMMRDAPHIFQKLGKGMYALKEWGLSGLEKTTSDDTQIQKEDEGEDLSHWDVMGMLLDLGNMLGYKTYVADPKKIYNDRKLGEIASLIEVPSKFREIPRIQQVDVIWFKNIPPYFFFEVEDRGSMKDALHRLYQAIGLDARFIVVSPERNRAKFDKWMKTSPYSENRNKYVFRSYEDLFIFFRKVTDYHSQRKIFLGS